MKRLIYITILSILLLSSCSKPSPAPAPAPEQYSRYIFFSQGVLTKASLIEDVDDIAGQDFGVIGFKYDSDWATYSATNPTPNVFYDDNGLTDVETVTVSADGTSATYSPLQGWANTKKYAFFAFYPAGNPAVTLANPTDGSAYTGGVPAIRYTMDPTDLKASMVDVMTAPAHIDQYWKSATDNTVSGGEIDFEFTHCLSALGLNLKNSSDCGITVNSVTFHLTGLQYQNITIALDGSAKTSGGSSIDIDCDLAVEEGGITVPSVTSDADGVEVADKLIFIPQDSALGFTVTVGYTRTLDTYETIETSFTTGPLSTALAEGKKHIVNLNFTDSTVDVGMTSGAWVDIPTVEDTFN